MLEERFTLQTALGLVLFHLSQALVLFLNLRFVSSSLLNISHWRLPFVGFPGGEVRFQNGMGIGLVWLRKY